MFERFRFEDSYQKVYEYDADAHGYVFYASYFACGIDEDMTEEKKNSIVLEHYYN